MENLQYYYDCVDEVLALYWRTLGQVRDIDIHAGDVEYATAADGKSPECIFRVNIQTGDVEERINEVVAHIKAGIIPDGLLITPNTKPDNLVEILTNKGFILDETGLIMAADLRETKLERKNPPSLAIKRVENEEEFAQWVGIINKDLFGYEVLSYDQFHDMYDLDDTYFYLAYHENIAVAACMTIVGANVADVDMVATKKDYRKKGIASELLITAMIELKDMGIDVASLRAKPEGINLYKRLGYKEYAKRKLMICDYEQVNKKTTCCIGEEGPRKAKEIYESASSIESFVKEMKTQKVIGRDIRYDESEHSIYLTKKHADECGGGCAGNETLIGKRCHCGYMNYREELLDMDYCKCSAEFFRPMFGPLFGDNVVIEPVETVLAGGTECIFMIKLSK